VTRAEALLARALAGVLLLRALWLLTGEVLPGGAKDPARFHLQRGLRLQYRLQGADLEGALRAYDLSLRANPLYGAAWRARAAALLQADRTEEALQALERFLSLSRPSASALWEAGVLALLAGRPQRAWELMARFLRLRPQEQRRVFSLLEPSWAARYLPGEFRSAYLHYLVEHERPLQALAFWQQVGGLGPEDGMVLCNGLLRKGRWQEARALWLKLRPGAQEGLLYNPSLDAPLAGGCLGWRPGQAQGIRVLQGKEGCLQGSCVLVHFDGSRNLQADALTQTVVLEPGRTYVLRAMLRVQGITTRSGPRLRVRTLHCSTSKYWLSEDLQGSTGWRPLQVRFQLPEDCALVEVSLHRLCTWRLDSKIKGLLWTDQWMLKGE
jgi:hypothetical protein